MSLVIACTPETFRDCGTKKRTCTRIEVIQLTALMGIGSLGRMIFPPDKKFQAWIAETTADTKVPEACQLNASDFSSALNTLSLRSETKTSLAQLIPLVKSNLMTAVLGPPGTGKTTNISGFLRLLLQHHRHTTSRTSLQIFLCAPTNHAVEQLERIVSDLEPDNEFTFIRICSAKMMKGTGKGKSFSTGRRKCMGKGRVQRTFENSVVDRKAQHVDVNSLSEVLVN